MAGFLPTLYLQSLLSITKAKVVILDWVVSQAENFGDIGFTVDDHRGNVLSVFAYERSAYQHSASRYSFWELRSHLARD